MCRPFQTPVYPEARTSAKLLLAVDHLWSEYNLEDILNLMQVAGLKEKGDIARLASGFLLLSYETSACYRECSNTNYVSYIGNGYGYGQ
jgi:hypothetical protein